jgi:hypothetical protein
LSNRAIPVILLIFVFRVIFTFVAIVVFIVASVIVLISASLVGRPRTGTPPASIANELSRA